MFKTLLASRALKVMDLEQKNFLVKQIRIVKAWASTHSKRKYDWRYCFGGLELHRVMSEHQYSMNHRFTFSPSQHDYKLRIRLHWRLVCRLFGFSN